MIMLIIILYNHYHHSTYVLNISVIIIIIIIIYHYIKFCLAIREKWKERRDKGKKAIINNIPNPFLFSQQ